MNKLLTVVVAGLVLAGCVNTPEPEPIVVESNVFIMAHPQVPNPPTNPNVTISVITEENIDPGKAYVGFEYNEWLRFAEWMHQFKQHQVDLRNVIELYKQQDPKLKKDVDVNPE